MEKITKQADQSSSILVAPMKGGDGVYSYAHNSTLQGKLADAFSVMITEGILEMFDMMSASPSKPICIADLGCSVGPNTFNTVDNIINVVQRKYHSQGLHHPEIQVFFNDHATNDFNKLFSSFPPNKGYFAAGVPGSFYKRLFPVRSLHFVHSSTSLHWLSKVPEQVENVNSPSFNKGRIHYGGAPKEVGDSYLAQFYNDMDSFFSARAQEIVTGGLMAISTLRSTSTTSKHAPPLPKPWDIVGTCLLEMAQQGLVREAQVDSFNVPVYDPSAEEFVKAINSEGSFSIEKLDEFEYVYDKSEVNQFGAHFRALLEVLLSAHFGNEIMDDLFALFTKKVQQIYSGETAFSTVSMFVLLKRK